MKRHGGVKCLLVATSIVACGTAPAPVEGRRAVLVSSPGSVSAVTVATPELLSEKFGVAPGRWFITGNGALWQEPGGVAVLDMQTGRIGNWLLTRVEEAWMGPGGRFVAVVHDGNSGSLWDTVTAKRVELRDNNGAELTPDARRMLWSPTGNAVIFQSLGAALLAYSFSDGTPSMGESSCTASDPPQCESKSGTTGAAFIGGMPLLLVGGISAAVDLASKRRETRIRHTTAQVPSAQPVPCRQYRTAGISAALVVGEHQYSGKFDTAGVATIPVPESVWEQHPEGIKATLLLDGVAAGQVLLAPGVRPD